MKKAYTLGLYEKAMPAELSWKEKLKTARESGFDYLEISIDETKQKLDRLEMTREERHNLITTMKDTDMPIRSMCLSGHRKYPLGSNDLAICAKSLEIMEKAIEFADDLGIRIIQLAGYDVYYEKSDKKTQERFLENLQRAVDLAAKYGVLMGFETMETEFMNTVEKAMKYVNLISSPYLNVYPDIGNITNAAKTYGKDVLEDLKTGEGHLVAMHLKETVSGKFREIPFGTGHVNFQAAIEAAKKLGVRRFVTEFWYTGNVEWKKDLFHANKMMTNLLKE